MAVNLHTTHYRFGINELAESTHGWHAAEDANPAQGVIAVDTTFLLRFTVQETGGTAAGNVDQQFQCALNGGAFQDITTTSTIVKAVSTVAFANGADLTKRLSGTGTFESSGDGGTHDGLSGGAQNDIAASGNSETECGLQIVSADVSNNDVVTFRLTSPDFTITNDVVPTLTVSESAPVTVTPTTASLTTTTFAPTVLTPRLVTPPTASLTLTTFAPTVTGGTGTTVTPPSASLSLTTFAPTVSTTAHVTVTPTTAALVLATFAPTVTKTDNILVTPATAALNLTGYAPTVTGSEPPATGGHGGRVGGGGRSVILALSDDTDDLIASGVF